MELSEIRKVIQSIGSFYLWKNNGDVKKANEEIDSLRITKIAFHRNENLNLEIPTRVNITTMRPGMLIGAKGTNYHELQKHIGKEIGVIEEMDLGLLYSYEDPSNEDVEKMYDEWMEESWLTEDSYDDFVLPLTPEEEEDMVGS